jgi:hypothetical protein
LLIGEYAECAASRNPSRRTYDQSEALFAYPKSRNAKAIFTWVTIFAD